MPKRTPPRRDQPSAAHGHGVEDGGAEFVDKAEAYRRYVQEGLDDVAAGRVHKWEDVKAEMRAKYGFPKA
jgi:predicted transcriptional regulator